MSDLEVSKAGRAGRRGHRALHPLASLSTFYIRNGGDGYIPARLTPSASHKGTKSWREEHGAAAHVSLELRPQHLITPCLKSLHD